MRRFSAEYLRDTRRGLWDDRSALAPLELDSRTRILDVGAGTGEFTRVLESATSAPVTAVDADIELLLAGTVSSGVVGDATRLPFADGSFDLVVCQALLINLPDPEAAIEEFVRVSSDLVAAIEPDNSQVSVDSTVAEEGPLAQRAREYYMAGIETDVSLGPSVGRLFKEAGLHEVSGTRRVHERTVEPPYSEAALESAKRKVTASRLDEQRQTMLQGNLTTTAFEALRDEWQEMGRSVASQIADGSYRRSATVPFYVTVGRK